MNLSKFLSISFSFVLVGLAQERVHAQSVCSSNHVLLLTREGHRDDDLFNGGAGRVSFQNFSSEVRLTSCHPDVLERPFNFYTIEADKLAYTSKDRYSSPQGVQIGKKSIDASGRISGWEPSSGIIQPYFLVKVKLLNTTNKYAVFSSAPSSFLARQTVPKSAINVLLNACPKLIKSAATRKRIVAKLREYRQESMALQVQNGICPSIGVIDSGSQPSGESSSPTLTRKQYFVRGNKRYQKGDYQGAVEDYDFNTWRNAEIDSTIPNDTEFLLPEMSYNRGNAYYKQGKYLEAIRNYQEAVKAADLRPFPEAYYNMWIAKLALGDEEDAATVYESFLKVYTPPENIEDLIKNPSRPFLEDLEFSNLDGDILPILSETRWPLGRTGTPGVAKSAINTALNSCPKAIKYAASRNKLVARLKEYKQADMALQVQNGICPSNLR